MKYTLLAAAAAIGLVSGSAIAKPVDWTGWYWGFNAGYADVDADTSRDLSGTGYFAGASAPAIEASSNFSLNSSGVTAGVQYGYNHKLGSVVLGGEIDFSYLGASDAASATATYPCCVTTYTSTAAFDAVWQATLRAKLGVPVGSALAYATGGLALAEVEVTQGFSDTDGPTAFSSQSHSDTLMGWTAGAGIEIPVGSNMAVKFEYLYSDFGDTEVGPVAFVSGAPNRFSETTADVTSQTVSIGLNWHY